MEKLEHIGIAVKNMDQSNALFAALLGQQHYKIEAVESEELARCALIVACCEMIIFLLFEHS